MYFLGGLVLFPPLSYACDWGPPDDVVYIPSEVKVELLEGADIRDTIEARVPIRAQLTVPNDETTAPLFLPVTFTVLGEGCGDPLNGLTTSDRNNQATGTWVLGTMLQPCTMEIRVLAPNGTRLGFARAEATVEAGKPIDGEGWLSPGQVARAVDTLSMVNEEFPLFDRVFNDVTWRFLVIDGPAIVLGEELDNARSRTLVATGEGAGTIDLITKYGVFLRAGFNVCTSNNQRWIRVFRLEDLDTILAACP